MFAVVLIAILGATAGQDLFHYSKYEHTQPAFSVVLMAFRWRAEGGSDTIMFTGFSVESRSFKVLGTRDFTSNNQNFE